MKILFFILLLAVSSCGVKSYPIKGTYLDKPYETTVTKTKEQVWERIIDFFATTGISIKLIDRGSGLIMSEKSELKWSYEKPNGALDDPTAWVVVPRMIDKASNQPYRNVKVTGDWNIRIKEADGKTTINVNLVNINSVAPVYGMWAVEANNMAISGTRSTGVFEKMIADIIK